MCRLDPGVSQMRVVRVEMRSPSANLSPPTPQFAWDRRSRKYQGVGGAGETETGGGPCFGVPEGSEIQEKVGVLRGAWKLRTRGIGCLISIAHDGRWKVLEC